jgi:mono/diheme cytochrome c family protein
MVMRIILLAFACLFALPVLADEASVERGHYLADMGDCTSCHTTPEHGDFAGGLPLQAPFGTIYGSNITPDPTYGIGKYTLAQFITVMRKGVTANGTHLYPAMPYASFSTLSDSDLSDLYDYLLHGVAPVAYKPPETKLVFPFNQRWGMALWDWVFARHERYQPDPKHDAEWNRGAYIVQGLGHCGACHTPRGPAYEERGYDEKSPLYLGGSIADHWATANLQGDPGSGLGRWSESDIASFLKTGHGAGAAAFGNMKEAVEKSTSKLTDADLAAIAHYLKSLPDGDEPGAFKPGSAVAVSAARQELPGAGVFAGECSGCHGATGEGQLPRYPALAGNPVVMTPDPTSLIRILLEGSKSPVTPTGPQPARMPAFAKLTDREIAEVVSYLRTSWGNQAAPVAERDVAQLRAALAKNQRKQAEGKEKADEPPDQRQ